ncbi:MAG: peptidoglycan editing factor PgeF [Deltaproteobacteria bacterium]|nr:peptidoglycan editing factor PgeF [Deltaproteobacteria bacterium]
MAQDAIIRLESCLLKSGPDLGLSHGFLGRTGGSSKAPFESLNFDLRGADAPENVKANAGLASMACSAPLEAATLVNQVHGNAVVEANEENRPSLRATDADAIITSLTGIPLGILTADCLPVLFYDPIRRAIGVAHAGWKGTAAGVSVRTVGAMRSRYGSDPKDIIAAFGPSIGPCCYAVGLAVVETFKSAYPLPHPALPRERGGGKGIAHKSAWIEESFDDAAGKITFDLALANAGQLVEAGLSSDNIDVVSRCTACNSHEFFSYRKDNGVTGRQLSFIMLTQEEPCS